MVFFSYSRLWRHPGLLKDFTSCQMEQAEIASLALPDIGIVSIMSCSVYRGVKYNTSFVFAIRLCQNVYFIDNPIYSLVRTVSSM